MRIDRIQAKSFRCFKQLDFRPPAEGAVLFGENGAGKSALIRAILIGLSALPELSQQIENGYKTHVLAPSDLRVETRRRRGGLERRPSEEAQVILSLSIETADGSMKGLGDVRTYRHRFERAPEISIPKSFESRRRLNVTDESSLPLYAVYGATRSWNDEKPTDDPGGISDRLSGYRRALDAGSSLLDLRTRWRDMDHARVQLRQAGSPEADNHPLNAVESAVSALLDAEGATPFYDATSANDIMVELSEEGLFSLAELSDGYRNVIAIAADLALRAATLNPHLKHRAPELTPGIVLIDEVDLHLHPEWQGRVIPDLQRAFPRVQFFVSTHSEQVIASMPARCVFHMLPHEEGPQPINVPFARGATTERVLSELMSVPQRPRSGIEGPEYQARLKYLRLVKSGLSNTEEARRVLDEYSEGLPNDDGLYQANLEIRKQQFLRRRSSTIEDEQ